MYIDTSALVKLYLAEPGSEECEATVAGETLATSRLTVLEFRSALWGKVSRGIIPVELRDEVLREFEKDVTARRVLLVSLTDLVLSDASEVMEAVQPGVALRSLDALHLATFMGVEAGPLFTLDKRMLKAAAQLGLPLARPA